MGYCIHIYRCCLYGGWRGHCRTQISAFYLFFYYDFYRSSGFGFACLDLVYSYRWTGCFWKYPLYTLFILNNPVDFSYLFCRLPRLLFRDPLKVKFFVDIAFFKMILYFLFKFNELYLNFLIDVSLCFSWFNCIFGLGTSVGYCIISKSDYLIVLHHAVVRS